MNDFEANLFIYGSFDFLRKGLGFALCGDRISNDERVEISKIIEKIGNYNTSNPSEIQWLSTKTSSDKHLLLAFSFGGRDEHGRKTLISKGLLISETKFNTLQFNPFFILPNLKLDYSILKEEVNKNVFKPLSYQINHDLRNAKKVIEENYDIVKNLTFSIWTNSKIQMPFESTYLNILKTIYLLTPTKERKSINFITCASQLSDKVNITFLESGSLIHQNQTEVSSKLVSRFDVAVEILLSGSLEAYKDFISGRKKKKTNKIISFFSNFFKKKQV